MTTPIALLERKLPTIILGEIETTSDYTMFERYGFNRKVKDNRMRKMRKNLKQTNGNIVPILLSSSGRVIDGQHRLHGCILEGLPVRFLRTNIMDEYADTVIANINSVAKSFSPEDYANMWAEKGDQGYIHYKRIMESTETKFDTMRRLMNLSKTNIENGVSPIIYTDTMIVIHFIKRINETTHQLLNQKFRERELVDAIWILKKIIVERRNRGEDLPETLNFNKIERSFKHVIKDGGVFDRAEYIAKIFSQSLDFGRSKRDKIKLFSV